MTTKLAQLRKFIVYVVGGVAGVVAAGVLHGQPLAIAEGVLVFATGAGLYAVPNAPAPASGSGDDPGQVAAVNAALGTPR